ncbi:MAG: Flp family type IVb pilin [Deltaproteobacteria bacterium]|jgi:pilus assembly protein Flp/PilA|nr:Flp family type IVb pilin [Deltaproteobacteria bacterium]
MFTVLRYAFAWAQTLRPNFLKDSRGVTTIEYGILAAGLAIIIAVLVKSDGIFSKTLTDVFNNILDQLPQSDSASGGGSTE